MSSDRATDDMLVTTSGNYLPAAFKCTVEALGIDRVLLATDYPYEDSQECMRFLEGLPIAVGDRAKIYSQNATQAGICGASPTENSDSQNRLPSR